MFQGRLGADGVGRVVDAEAVTVQWVQDYSAPSDGWLISGPGLSTWTLSHASVRALKAGVGKGQCLSAALTGPEGEALARLLAGPVVVAARFVGCEV